jgi:hypothetical protein
LGNGLDQFGGARDQRPLRSSPLHAAQPVAICSYRCHAVLVDRRDYDPVVASVDEEVGEAVAKQGPGRCQATSGEARRGGGSRDVDQA